MGETEKTERSTFHQTLQSLLDQELILSVQCAEERWLFRIFFIKTTQDESLTSTIKTV